MKQSFSGKLGAGAFKVMALNVTFNNISAM